MKAYSKEEVDMTFSGYQSDLDQLETLEVVPVEELNKIIERIKNERDNTHGDLLGRAGMTVAITKFELDIEKYLKK